MGLEDYPKREAFFAHRFLRLLTKTAAAQELRPEVCWLLTVVAMQEDSKRYTEPAKWYLEQLLPLCGYKSNKSLTTAIGRAVAEGWLVYLHGSKTRPGRFWVTIPKRFECLDDGPCDEGTLNVNITGNAGENRERIGKECALKVHTIGRPSIPVPNPIPKDRSSSRLDPLFEEFWEVFPKLRRTKRKEAMRRWAEATKAVDPRYLIDRARAYAASPLGQSEFACMPSSWLSGGRWEDSPEAWSMKAGKSDAQPQAKLYVSRKRQEATA